MAPVERDIKLWIDESAYSKDERDKWNPPSGGHAEQEILLRHPLAGDRLLSALDKVSLDDLCSGIVSMSGFFERDRGKRLTSDISEGIVKSEAFI